MNGIILMIIESKLVQNTFCKRAFYFLCIV